ncbi:5-formyltetrahydrofolate cyclo-ligase [Vibrio gazogenes]|uniref:5-formyltetrahydrofolate cyclo-ligase n=1 Tax=Vibrio gazogenes DSM 21264 = NBRC 103151 TaxID=1123492 RepID=A0A1M5CRA2_VIBGA|nr:5-formyltetrahydrofolate cyclo-ligase [Vibrio gazogenes]USP14157.1 5-formyltetrahydrofolate cyclo-ligase [Vibrio gazogenes]SHF57268.1 5-formyltetrahydrofolate cyclo-ligase [Vibrio gazogenes DSM 21264] [Vibrio gazogenes DSM 21264 = NBRC 103151]
MHQNDMTRADFRKQIRDRRKQLSDAFQQAASEQMIRQLSHLPELDTSQHIAVYLSTDGELSTHALIEWLWQQGKSVYLPVLHPFSTGQLLFLRYTPETDMVQNRYGIAEPRLNQLLILPTRQLDLIFTPLVGFDASGHRLGMGGGYYDRTLEPWFKSRSGAKPIGLAHSCQFVERLPIESWDVPLPKIVTPDKIWSWE